MLRAYLFLNAALYLLFAIWCTVKPSSTAESIGYTTRNASGHSEYLVIYGGLQLGLAFFFAWLGAKPELHRTGAIFSLLFYAPIVLYRLATVAKYWPVSNLTLGTGALELGLLIGAMLAVAKT